MHAVLTRHRPASRRWHLAAGDAVGAGFEPQRARCARRDRSPSPPRSPAARLRRCTGRRPSSTSSLEVLLLEVGLLHQPVREAAQQFGLRPAAVEAAGPQPELIGQQLRDAAFADPVEDQQRLVVGARSSASLPARCAWPRRARNQRPQVGCPRSACSASPAPSRRQVGGDRMALADVGDLGPERLLEHAAGRAAGRTSPSGVRKRLCAAANSGPTETSSAPPLAHVVGDVARSTAWAGCRARRSGRR